MEHVFRQICISVWCLIFCCNSFVIGGFADPKAMDPGIPDPASVVGHSVDEKAVRYEPLVGYMKLLAAKSDKVILTSYGKTHEGRTLYYLTITSKANSNRLDQIKYGNARLADPRKLKDSAQEQKLLDNLPAVAWMGYSIHGDELSSTDAAMYLAYQLAAGKDKATEKLLDNVVIHIDPLMNPDGRERYLGQLEQLNGQIPTSDYQALQHSGLWSAGRGNHYLFDLNRDCLVQELMETRARSAAILSWNPHLLVDSHEMGGTNTYLMDPPTDPINIHLSDKNLDWRAAFSADQSAAFNRQGWSYYTRDWYTEWSPIYTSAWANLTGAAGLLYEQAGVDGASVKQATGHELTYRQSVHHQLVSSLANLKTLCQNRRAILADFLADRQWAISGKGPYNETFLMPPPKDKTRLKRFVEVLKKQDIEFSWAAETVKARNVKDIWGNKIDSKELPAGTLVVSSAQPRRRMIHAMLEFDPHLKESFLLDERKSLESHKGTLLYDTSSWNVPMCYGLDSYWAGRVEPVKLTAKSPTSKAGFNPRRSAYGYLLKFDNSDIYQAIVKLFDKQCNMRIATKPFKFAGTDYIPGTVLLRSHENPKNLAKILKDIAADYDVDIVNADTARVSKGPDLGGSHFTLLHKPRVAILSQWPTRTTSFGSSWYLLDHQAKLRVSPINIQRIGRVDLRKYNVLILTESSKLDSVFGDGTVKKIKRWVEDGGTLIAAGSSAAYLAQEKHGISSVRLKRNVLDKLKVYEEAVRREKDARAVKVNFKDLWSAKPASVDKNKVANQAKDDKTSSGKARANKDIEQLKRDDKWQRLFSPTGVFVKSQLDKEHWLCFGLGNKLPMMFWGSNAFMSKYPIATPVRLAESGQLRMSGLLWPEARQRIANTAFATTESLGNGQVILFAIDPTFRSWLTAEERLFLNAVLLGPGLGTSPPMPW